MTDESSAIRANKVESSLLALNARIARLTLMLGIRLDHESDLQRVLARQHPQYVGGTTPGEGTRADFPSKRLHQEWEELRALLSMRCDLMANCLVDLGLENTRLIANQAELDLTRMGFEPSASGFHLQRQMNQA
jgi:hypothetical protein